jgi:hypothetical protein
LLDLLSADRRRRLQMQADLIADGAVLAAATTGAADDVESDDDAPVLAPRRGRSSAAAGTSARRPSPAERRGAVIAVVAVWKDVCRDVAVAARGGRRELTRIDLLDDLVRAGATVDADAAARFLVRLDAATRALDAYANPELTLDALLIGWPRARAAA